MHKKQQKTPNGTIPGNEVAQQIITIIYSVLISASLGRQYSVVAR
jgi:hypothetical protein